MEKRERGLREGEMEKSKSTTSTRKLNEILERWNERKFGLKMELFLNRDTD